MDCEHKYTARRDGTQRCTRCDAWRPMREILADTEKNLIGRALHATNGNVSQATVLLSMPLRTLWTRIGHDSDFDAFQL